MDDVLKDMLEQGFELCQTCREGWIMDCGCCSKWPFYYCSCQDYLMDELCQPAVTTTSDESSEPNTTGD